MKNSMESSAVNKAREQGKLFGLGIGPGDPGLLTIKALKVLENSDVLLIPKARPNSQSLAYEIVQAAFSNYSHVDKLPPTKELIFPMIRDKEELAAYWDRAMNLVVNEVTADKQVSLITLGDPTLYSTYSYLLTRLNKEYPNCSVETIPGIYSFSAISSRLNLPLTMGEEKMIIIPVEENKDYTQELNNYNTVIFMKVSSDFQNLLQQLKAADREKEAILISRLGQEKEYITKNLEELRGTKIDYFSTLIVNSRIPLVGDNFER